MADLDAKLRDHLRSMLGVPGLDFVEGPTPISGGFDTRILAFRLAGAPPAFAGPLIVRLLVGHPDPSRALREQAIQNALVELGYPAPRVLAASADTASLGSAFLIMERLAGKPLPQAQLLRMGRIVGDLQARLHDLDAEVFFQRLVRAGVPERGVTFDGYLGQLAHRIASRPLAGLARAIEWLIARRPPPDRPRVVCHGDFHPYNILMADGAVTGVVDWANTIVADPAFDVATTLVILKLVPVELFGLPAPLQWLVKAARPVLVAGYLRGYRKRREIDRERLRYYEAAACMKPLVRAGELRLSRRATDALDPLFGSDYVPRLARHLQAITGITSELPADAAPQSVR